MTLQRRSSIGARMVMILRWILVAPFIYLAADTVLHAALPSISLTAMAPQAWEGESAPGGFRITRSGATEQPLTVYYSTSGSASAGRDFKRLPGSVTIPTGQDSAIILVEPLTNTISDGAATVTLTLRSNTAPFTIAILPDTQYYVSSEYGGTPLMFDRQTAWIAEHRDDQHIALVLHEGDITEDNTEEQWEMARRYMSRLDGVVPYVVCLGNHDGLSGPTRQTDLFNRFFSVTNYQSQPTFGGVFEPNQMDNSFHVFRAGGVDWLVLSLEFGPRDSALAWAAFVVTNHPQHRVIVLTHAYLYYDDTLLGSSGGQHGMARDYGRWNDATEMWTKFIRKHANIAFVFCGHIMGDGTGRLVSIGDNGNRVFQILANYQGYTYGGAGWMRLLEFRPEEDRLVARTYSPYLGLYRNDVGNDFEYDHLGIFSPSNSTYAIEASNFTATVLISGTQPNAAPPVLAFAEASFPPDEVRLVFSQPVAFAPAANVSNYRLNEGPDFVAAKLSDDLRTVTLRAASWLTPGATYTLMASNVLSQSAQLMLAPIDIQASFCYAPLLFADTFEQEDMRNWTVVDEGSIASPSLWGVAEGKIRQVSGIYGPFPGAAMNRHGTFAFWNTPAAFAWTNYEFFVVINSRDEHGLGLLFRYYDPSNYYKLEFDRSQNFRQLTKTVAGSESLLAREAGGYVQNQDLVTQVRVERNRIEVTLDGFILFGGPVWDGSLAAGSVALYSWASEGVSFGEVQVTPLDQPPRVVMEHPVMDSSGRLSFFVTGSPRAFCRMETSTDMLSWMAVTNVSPFRGRLGFTYPVPNMDPPGSRQFFRVVIP